MKARPSASDPRPPGETTLSWTVHVRQYADADWEGVREIYDLAQPDEMRGSVALDAVLPLDADAAMLRLFRASVIFVVEDENRLIGFGGYKGNYISWLFVHPAHRRKGVAWMLLVEILKGLRGAITLNVAAGNHAARKLYEDLGFTVSRAFTGQFNGHAVEIITLMLEKTD